MTVARPEDFETGLEEFGIEDAVIPRITIVHKEGLFKDSLSNQEFDKITCIILGLVKQRSLWHPTVDDGDWPMCRSMNHETGFPNLSDEQPKEKRFNLLWDKAGFDPKDFPEDAEGRVRLPCGSCQLKEWGSHPDGKKPYCSEQFTLPILYDPDGDGIWVPAIVTFQKTALKGLKAYLSSFARSKSAAFQAVTEVTLRMEKKGSTDYSVPEFKKVGTTDEENWLEYSTNYRTMANFLRADPGSRDDSEDTTPASKTPPKVEQEKSEAKADDDGDVVDAEVVEEPAQAVKSEAKADTPAAAEDDDDDLPF